MPGTRRTTAYLLLRLALGRTPHVVAMPFDRIVDAVAQGSVAAGLIIHESRFTYQTSGLHAICDLGEWWEAATGLPIPLGAILARRDLPPSLAQSVNESIRESLHFARTHENRVMPYVRAHAFELAEDVMRKHIDLYVNEYSDDLSPSGRDAVNELIRRGRAAGLLPSSAEPDFA